MNSQLFVFLTRNTFLALIPGTAQGRKIGGVAHYKVGHGDLRSATQQSLPGRQINNLSQKGDQSPRLLIQEVYCAALGQWQCFPPGGGGLPGGQEDHAGTETWALGRQHVLPLMLRHTEVEASRLASKRTAWGCSAPACCPPEPAPRDCNGTGRVLTRLLTQQCSRRSPVVALHTIQSRSDGKPLYPFLGQHEDAPLCCEMERFGHRRRLPPTPGTWVQLPPPIPDSDLLGQQSARGHVRLHSFSKFPVCFLLRFRV